jgi:hypothetical protein
MGNVYLWKVGDKVVNHTDIAAAAQINGVTRQPDKTVTDAQWAAAGGLARVINNKIVLGKTDQETADETARRRIAEIGARLERIEREMTIPLAAHNIGAETPEDTAELTALVNEAKTLRAERKVLEDSLSTPL